MNGQGILGKFCAWCDYPATCDVTVEPATMGVRRGREVLIRAPLIVPACQRHRFHVENPSPKVPFDTFRRRQVKADQLALFGGEPAAEPDNAIGGWER